jgi:hypothetical protein
MLNSRPRRLLVVLTFRNIDAVYRFADIGIRIGGRKTTNVLGWKRSEKAVKRFNFDREGSSLTIFGPPPIKQLVKQ